MGPDKDPYPERDAAKPERMAEILKPLTPALAAGREKN